MSGSNGPIILFGGTFDPPHRGHVELPARAADLVDASRVLFIPAGINPQKTEHPPTEAGHRTAMLEAAIAGDPRASISRIELDRSGPSYTFDTVAALHAELERGHPPMRLLIGADQALNFRSWRRWQELEALAEPLVMPRAPHTIDRLEARFEEAHPGEAGKWMARVLDLPELDISSTSIREAVESGSDLQAMLPKPVIRYILENGLYGAPPRQGRLKT